jgi:hypothetical protein
MNPDSSLSIFFNQSIKRKWIFWIERKIWQKIKFFQKLTVDFESSEENFYNWNLT